MKNRGNISQAQLEQLLKTLERGESLLIFMHNNPDPDSIASAFILENIASSLGKKTKIVYGGYLTRAENKQMVDLLHIEVVPYVKGVENNYSLTAIVDTQAGSLNNIYPTSLTPDITLDHHNTPHTRHNFHIIDSSAGATASIALSLLIELDIPITKEVANAYCYAIIAETRDLGRGATPIDIYYFQKLYSLADPILLSHIRHAKKPLTYYQLLKEALTNFQIENAIVSVILAQVDSPEYVSEIADTLVDIQDVSYSIVIAKLQDKYFVSTRTSKDNIEIDEILRKAIGSDGNCGGHDMIAAGIFYCDPKQLVQRFHSAIAEGS